MSGGTGLGAGVQGRKGEGKWAATQEQIGTICPRQSYKKSDAHEYVTIGL